MPRGSDALKSLCHSLVVSAMFAVFYVADVCAQNEDVAVDAAMSDASTFIDADSLVNPVVRGISDADAMQRADIIERCFSSPFNKYASLNRLIEDFQFWQRFMLPFSSQTTEAIYAQHGKFRVFDPTGFPMQVLSGLVPETYRDAVDVYRVTVCEDPVSRERVLYNLFGDEIWRQPAPVHDTPWSYLQRVQSWKLHSRTTETRNLETIYDPARIRCEYLLMPVDSLPEYALVMAIESLTRAMEMAANPPAMMMNAYVPAADEFVFTDLVVTGGVVDVEIHLPDGIACRVDLFQSSVLPGFPWSLVTTTPTNSGTFRVQFACSLSNAFFRAGNADIDTDGDGIPDDREILMYGTNPLQWDTDGDGIPDGWEIAHGLNPLDPSDANADPDGDGYSNLEEYLRASDPHAWNEGGGSTIRYFYDPDDRLSATFTENNSGAAQVSMSLANNILSTAERGTP